MTNDTLCEEDEVVLQGRETLRPILPSTSTVSENCWCESGKLFMKISHHLSNSCGTEIKFYMSYNPLPADPWIYLLFAGEGERNKELTLVIESGWYEGNDPC